MIAFLLLALVFGGVCAVDPQPTDEELSGSYYSIYVAADKKEKVAEGSPLRGYVRTVEKKEKTMSFTFYVMMDGKCQLFKAEGTKVGPNKYVIDYSGNNYFEIVMSDKGVLALYVVNTSENHEVTSLVELFAKSPSISEEIYEKFVDKVQEKGIPKENIVNVSDTDTCPRNNN